ncbi:MAG: MBL fold metallo-hydrolase [Methanomassiliicoccales archaeon]
MLVESGDSRLFLDFGKSFWAEKRFFQEPFLSPRGCSELRDMGILPRVEGIYRGDRPGRMDGVVLSHGHADHYDSIRFLRDDIPVVCSPTTKRLVISREHCGNHSTPMAKLTKRNGEECFKEFLETGEGRPLRVGEVEVLQMEVDHSLPGACGTVLDTGDSRIVYTGDIRFHGPRGRLSEDFLSRASEVDPDLLIIEGTNVMEGRMGDEGEVFRKTREVVSSTLGLVMVSYSQLDLDRMSTLCRVAEETGRRLLINPKQAYCLLLLERDDLLPHGVSMDSLGLFQREKRTRSRYEEVVSSEWMGEEMGAEEVNQCQEEVILTFTLYDMNEALRIEPLPGSAYILSSSDPFDEEMEIGHERLCNWLGHLGVPMYHIHASGHATPHQLKRMVREISPEKVVPVHTPCPELYTRYLSDLDVQILRPLPGESVML